MTIFAPKPLNTRTAMQLLFEYLGIIGLVLIGVGGLWLFPAVIRGAWKKALTPTLVLLAGIAIFAFPMIYTRMSAADRSSIERTVGDEEHVLRNGWDGTDYSDLAGMPNVIVLQIANPDVTDTTLEYIVGMSELRELDLSDTQITDAGLAIIAQLGSLDSLRLRGTQITDAGFRAHLMNHPKLRRLNLQGTLVTTETVSAWKSAGEGRRALQ